MTEVIPHKLRVDARCRDCLFHSRMANDSIGKACITLGVEAYAKPCSKFRASPFRLEESKTNNLQPEITQLLSKIKESDVPALAVLVNAEKGTRKQGFAYGQTVYLQFVPRDYLSNWAQAIILSADSQFVYLKGEDGFVGSFKRKHVKTEKAFLRLKTQMLKNNKVRDPASYSKSKGGVVSLTTSELRDPLYKPPKITSKRGPKPKGKRGPKPKGKTGSVSLR